MVYTVQEKEGRVQASHHEASTTSGRRKEGKKRMAENGIRASEYIPANEGDNHCHEVNCDGIIKKERTINPELHIDVFKCDKCGKRYVVRNSQ